MAKEKITTKQPTMSLQFYLELEHKNMLPFEKKAYISLYKKEQKTKKEWEVVINTEKNRRA